MLLVPKTLLVGEGRGSEQAHGSGRCVFAVWICKWPRAGVFSQLVDNALVYVCPKGMAPLSMRTIQVDYAALSPRLAVIPHPLNFSPSFDVQNMDQTLNEQRRTGQPVEYTTKKMSELTSTQNEFIYNELWHVFRVNLAPKIQHKLDECSHDAYLAVRAKLAMEGRNEQLVRAWTGKTNAVEVLPTFGRNIRRPEGAAAQTMPATDVADSAIRTTSASSADVGGERRAGTGTARPAHGRDVCARGEGDGAVNASAYSMGGGGNGNDGGPRGHLAGSTANDQGRQQREQRHDPEELQVRKGATPIPYP